MNITTEAEIDGAAAKKLREEAGLTQREFWNRLGLTQSGGCRYEGGQTIPKTVRILLFAMYVAGIRIDPTTKDGGEELRRLGALQRSIHAEDAEAIGKTVDEAMKAVRKASRLLNSIA